MCTPGDELPVRGSPRRSRKGSPQVIAHAARWLHSSREDRRLLLEAFSTLLGVRTALWVRRFDQVQAWASRPAVGPPGQPQQGARAGSRIAWALAVTGRYVPSCTCLTRALAARLMLRKRGELSCRLRIGVARDDAGRLRAHAWLEHRGRILVGGSEELGRFAVLAEDL